MYRYASHVVGKMAIYNNIRQTGGAGARDPNATTLVKPEMDERINGDYNMRIGIL